MAATAQKPVVIVTGASKGIGLAVTKALLETFKTIVVTFSRSQSPELTALMRKYPADLLSLQVDVGKEQAVREGIEQTLKTYHRIDGLILNAGVLEPVGPVGASSTSIAQWRSHFDINFFSLVYTIQAALPALKESANGGRIVFVSSGAAVGNVANWGPYNASKAAMNSLCRTLAQEEPEVVCVALRPGMVDTPMQALLRSLGPDNMRADDLQRFTSAYEGGKLVKPEDSGHVIASLSLNAPKSLSGQFVPWDGPECKDFRRVAE
ncbi:short-chain dehydrogenase [Schizopora paradoxa]|uniref:Short-chain dehydrogenase n=1 Tax=Schizopora paradoxa TaxID=27342 RepID=A0A0H2S201_9AGAM|nr:short-chain dehydrogenase [Schizopora paradoxa]